MEAFAFCLLAITLTGKFIFCVAEALLLWGIYQRYCADMSLGQAKCLLDDRRLHVMFGISVTGSVTQAIK